jgi:hypothetical protein
MEQKIKRGSLHMICCFTRCLAVCSFVSARRRNPSPGFAILQPHTPCHPLFFIYAYIYCNCTGHGLSRLYILSSFLPFFISVLLFVRLDTLLKPAAHK